MSVPNRTTTIPIINGGTYITPNVGYVERPRLGGTNYISPPTRNLAVLNADANPPPRQRMINGLIVYENDNNRITNTVTTSFSVRR